MGSPNEVLRSTMNCLQGLCIVLVVGVCIDNLSDYANKYEITVANVARQLLDQIL